MESGARAVADYIAGFQGEVRERLETVRQMVRNIAPDAVEAISYGMPTFRQGGNLLHFAAFKDHIGIYGAGGAAEAFKKELGDRKTTKGSIQFRHDEPLPVELLRKIVEHRVLESAARIAERKATKAARVAEQRRV